MKILSYWLLGGLTTLGIVVPAILGYIYLYKVILIAERCYRDYHLVICICLTLWILAGLVLVFLLGRQTIEILAKTEEITQKRQIEQEIRAAQKQVESEKFSLATLEKLVSLQKDKPDDIKIKALYEFLKPLSK